MYICFVTKSGGNSASYEDSPSSSHLTFHETPPGNLVDYDSALCTFQ